MDGEIGAAVGGQDFEADRGREAEGSDPILSESGSGERGAGSGPKVERIGLLPCLPFLPFTNSRENTWQRHRCCSR